MSSATEAARPFGPHSLSWKIGRETVLLLGGRRALLLQVAHPMVAQGVADHSNFERNRFGRLFRTLELSYTVMFGDDPEIQQAIDRVRAVHRTVTGSLPEDVGVWKAGTNYRAEDPELLLWVHATLVKTAIDVYQRFVRKLPEEELEQYYRESGWATQLLGIPREVLPSTYRAFIAYWEGMLSSGKLAVGPAAAQIARTILYPKVGVVPKRLFDPLNTITIGLLPPSLRQEYGLRWNGGRAAAFWAATQAMRRMTPLLPARLRYVSKAIEGKVDD